MLPNHILRARIRVWFLWIVKFISWVYACSPLSCSHSNAYNYFAKQFSKKKVFFIVLFYCLFYCLCYSAFFFFIKGYYYSFFIFAYIYSVHSITKFNQIFNLKVELVQLIVTSCVDDLNRIKLILLY